MIIGHGAIASALEGYDRDDRIYFAAGVANSMETRIEEFEREYSMVESQPDYLRLVYFSSLRVFTHDDVYTIHKLNMEDYIQGRFPQWTIMRLGNIDWATNPKQLVPWLRDWKGSPPLDDNWRHLLTKDEFLYWIGLIPEWNCEMNVTGERLKPIDIVRRLQWR